MKNILMGLSILLISGSAFGRYYDDNVAYGKVVDVQPVYERVSVPQRHQVCDSRRYRQKQPNAAGAVVGGILGGVLGSQFGSGSGRDAATAAGVIAGITVGAKSGGQRRHQPRCYTDVRYRDERQLSGYDVTYEYQGQWYETFMRQHPGDRVRLAVDVQVIE